MRFRTTAHNAISAFYTGGFIAPTQRTEIGGREMLCSEGYITENPELVYAVYDMLYEGSLVTATFRYGKKDYGKRETRLRIEEPAERHRVGITARILRKRIRTAPKVPSFFIKGSGRRCGQDHRESVCRRREYGQQLRERLSGAERKGRGGLGSMQGRRQRQKAGQRGQKSRTVTAESTGRNTAAVQCVSSGGSGEYQNSVGSACRSAAGCGWRLMNSRPRPKARRTV